MTTKSHNASDPCGFCAAFGYYLPWSMILAGGIVAVVPALSIFAQSSAYVVAAGLALLAGSAVLSRFGKFRLPRP
ncbi:hypothetical protein ACFOOL_07465 [Devosia honganensis]|uniref:Uncharacterized protein n=1 Tax=Devosia honganensis TaxID=1610527 RepID=A0ABV7WZ65_9HYPH